MIYPNGQSVSSSLRIYLFFALGIVLAHKQKQLTLPAGLASLNSGNSMTLDNLTEEAALRWLALLDRVKRHEDNFSLMLAQRGLCVETLAENPRITDFDHFLPNGATHWAARGAYGCTICLIPAQPSAVQYVQHLLGKKHKETFERLISYVASFVYPESVIERGRLCKICLKVTRRAMEEHERSSRHKVSLRAWPQTPRPQQVDVNMA